MHFCSIAMNWIQDILEENSSWQIYKLMEGHYVYPIKDLVGTGHIPNSFMVYDLYHHNDSI